LSADNWKQLWIPEGFAHGFCTLTENVELLYKVTTPYSADHDRGLAYDDALLGIAWPVRGADVVLSYRDKKNPPLSSLPQHFIY
jgi:dTDP-4-dehydrorhamnose 3,5-epimerase